MGLTSTEVSLDSVTDGAGFLLCVLFTCYHLPALVAMPTWFLSPSPVEKTTCVMFAVPFAFIRVRVAQRARERKVLYCGRTPGVDWSTVAGGFDNSQCPADQSTGRGNSPTHFH